MFEHLCKLRASSPLCPGDFFLEDPLAFCPLQLLKLNIEVLVFGRDARVAEIHGTHKAVANVVAKHYRFATMFCNQKSGPIPRNVSRMHNLELLRPDPCPSAF